MADKIPHPEYTSWMHERCQLPVETLASSALEAAADVEAQTKPSERS